MSHRLLRGRCTVFGRRGVLALLALVLALSVGGVVPADKRGPEAPDLAVSVRVAHAATLPQRPRVVAGIIPAVPEAPFYVGKDRGYFEAEGIEFDWEVVTVSSEALAQTAAGNLQLADATVGAAALNAFARGLNVRIIAGTYGTPPSGPHAFPFVVRRALYDSGEVRDPAALRGRRVALNASGVFSEYGLMDALRRGGLSVTDVDIQNMPFPDMPAALANGAVDAAFLPEPFGAQAIQLGAAVQIVPDFLPDTQVGVLIAGESFLREPARVEAFLRGYLRALRDLERD